MLHISVEGSDPYGAPKEASKWVPEVLGRVRP